MKKRSLKKRLPAVLFALYAAVMLWLLFFRSGLQPDSYFNFIPLRTVRMYLGMLGSGEPYRVYLAVVNLFGNVLTFVPLGFFLPLLLPRLRRFPLLLAVSAGLIAAVELLQYLTRLGVADLDDLILNLLGAALGYFFFRLFSARGRRSASRERGDPHPCTDR